MRIFHNALFNSMIFIIFLTIPFSSYAQYSGYRSLIVPNEPSMTVGLFYPTTVPEKPVQMGPWIPVFSVGSQVSDVKIKGLILISHGSGGTELNHHNLGTRLAREGYLVASVRHIGDNWQDHSLITSKRYFSERPLQLSRALDAILEIPEWAARIPPESIGAIGHSAGGYSLLALVGGHADPKRSAEHCKTVADDPVYCSLAKGAIYESEPKFNSTGIKNTISGEQIPVLTDHRIRAIVVLAPMGVVLTPESLNQIKIPVQVFIAENDNVLNNKYHGEHIISNLPNSKSRTVVGAGHFAFMAQPTFPLPSAAGDASNNPSGFDRLNFLSDLENEIVDFFDRNLNF